MPKKHPEQKVEVRKLTRKHVRALLKKGIDIRNISDDEFFEKMEIVLDVLYPDMQKELDILGYGELTRLVAECINKSFITENEGNGKN